MGEPVSRRAAGWRGMALVVGALHTTAYTLRLFDGAEDSPVVRLHAGAPAGETCSGKPC